VRNWSTDDISDLAGRVVVVTGANSGVGFEAARVFARAGATTILAGRSEERNAAAMARIRVETPAADLVDVRLDLASLKSVRAAAAELSERGVDVLVNNAGVMAIPRSETEDGFEMQFGVNHLGHFVLTAELWPEIRDRVVTVSSLVHHIARIDWDDLMGTRRYQKWPAYARSKLANVLFALELGRRAKSAGSTVRSILCHPGYSATNLTSVGPKMTKNPLLGGVMGFGDAVFAQTAEAGARPTVMAAIADLPTGSFTGPDGPMEFWGKRPRVVKAARIARSEKLAKRLWDRSEELTGVRFDITG